MKIPPVHSKIRERVGCGLVQDRPQSLFDSDLKNFTAKLGRLVFLVGTLKDILLLVLIPTGEIAPPVAGKRPLDLYSY